MDRPNVLIFMTDHQRGDTVLPEHPAITPNLDRMAREGVTFANTFCCSPHCCPARASFFSGVYPSRNGIWNNVLNDQALGRALKPGVRLWSEELAEAGYRMLFVGKWHVSAEEWPRDRGWEELFVSASPEDRHETTWEHYRRVAEQEARPDALPRQRGEGEILRPGYGTYRLYGTSEGNRHDEKVVALGVEAIRELTAGAQPWCLYVGAVAPHDPYMVPQKYLDFYDIEQVPAPPSYHDEMTDKPLIYRRMREQVFGQLSEREVREGVRHFWAYCTYLDELFGRLLAALEESRAAENTLVLYCADHGDYCGDHGLFAKGIPSFRGAYHVPFVVRWPAGIERPGRRVEEFAILADTGPTLVELAGGEPNPELTGRSLVPLLRGESPPGWRDEVHAQCNGVELYFTQRTVMTKDYKYVFNGFDQDELYDLRRDPHELINLANDPGYDHVKREMCRRMWRFARREQDGAISSYITVGLAPFGPAEAFRGELGPDRRAEA